jgi:hypothetical protein
LHDQTDALAGAIGELQPRRIGLGDLPSMARNTPRRMIEATSINGNSRAGFDTLTLVERSLFAVCRR